MSYKVVITYINSVNYVSRDSTLVEERHYTDSELRESHNWMVDRDKEKYTKKIYHDVDVQKTKDVEEKVYEQIVDDLNLRIVIGAVNGGIPVGVST